MLSFATTNMDKREVVPGIMSRPRATTPAEDRFLALSARRRRTTTVPQLVADHFQASGRRISATTVRNRLHNAGLYARRPVVCVPLNGRQRRNRLCWAREHVSWTQQQWASVLFTDESRFTMESDSGRLLIWREQRTRYHQSNTVERHSYRGGGILVWAGISLGGHTDLHVFHGGTVTGLRYRDEILDPYVRPYAAAIGNDFILMDDNARPHRARIVEEYMEDHGLERMEWPARSPDLNPIEHLWDYLGREVAALNPPPRSLHELKQGLLCVWGFRFLFRLEKWRHVSRKRFVSSSLQRKNLLLLCNERSVLSSVVNLQMVITFLGSTMSLEQLAVFVNRKNQRRDTLFESPRVDELGNARNLLTHPTIYGSSDAQPREPSRHTLAEEFNPSVMGKETNSTKLTSKFEVLLNNPEQSAPPINITAPNQWIGYKEPLDKACITWPLRSPDLTPCGFYLWVHKGLYIRSFATSLLIRLKT
ncbi:transposable element Tcb2 transposase [Trichonephila clavipes]|nr:transposable element Tcb2 transposase [Trichonephila clavipes]